MTELFKALKIEKNEEHQEINLVEISEDDLMEGNVVVDVTHSTLNYKDGLAMTGSSPIVRNFPMIPGIDFSGVVRSSEDSEFSKGDRVVLNGYDHFHCILWKFISFNGSRVYIAVLSDPRCIL